MDEKVKRLVFFCTPFILICHLATLNGVLTLKNLYAMFTMSEASGCLTRIVRYVLSAKNHELGYSIIQLCNVYLVHALTHCTMYI